MLQACARFSPGLAARRQGKTCFDFKRIDEALFVEPAALTARAYGLVDPVNSGRSGDA